MGGDWNTPLLPKKPQAQLGMPPGMDAGLTPQPPVNAMPLPDPGMSMQPPVQPLGQPAQPGTTPFSADSNLIGSQIGQTDFSHSKDLLGQAGGIAGQGLGASPDRQQLASDSYSALSKLDAAQEGKDIQGVGRRNAAFGRLGSGMVDTDLQDVFGAHDLGLANVKAQLAKETAGASLGDQIARGNFDLNRAGALQSLAGSDAQLGQTNRDELVGERGYQHGLDSEAVNNQFRQHDAEQGDQAQSFGQNAQINALLASLGFGGNTANTQGGVADVYQGNASQAQGGVGDILRNLFANKGAAKPAFVGSPD